MRMHIKKHTTRSGNSQRGLAPSDSQLKGGSTPLQNPRTNSKAATALELDYDPNWIEGLIANRMYSELKWLGVAPYCDWDI